MSYILDALKKADQERKQGEIPDLKSISPAVADASGKNRSTIWPAVAVAIAVAILWFRPWQQPHEIIQTGQPLTLKPEEKSTKATTSATTSPSNMVRESGQQAVQQSLEVQPANRSNALSPEEKQPATETLNEAITDSDDDLTRNLPTIMELPASLRNALPAIEISGHIYDENPASRMIIINDRVLREGRSATDKLSVHEITSNGVLLNFAGTLFFMSTFDAWPQ